MSLEATLPAEVQPEPRPAFSRALLTPGPLPPLSPLGLDLVRQAVESGLRYALYHLGLPVPETAPVQVIRQRLYLDARELRGLIAHAPGGPEVLAALLEPGGTGWLPANSPALAAALAFHKPRLARSRLPRRRPATPDIPEAPAVIWRRFRAVLARQLRSTDDAFLADLIGAIDRRVSRARGVEVPPALSRAAWRFRTGRTADLRSFGVPDLAVPSWAEEPAQGAAARRALAPHPLAGPDSYRGRFRETYRAALDLVAPLYRAFARQAADRGLIDSPEDAFFLPLQDAGELARPERPSWLERVVYESRSEHIELRQAAEPLDLMTERHELGPPGGERRERPEWGWAPLLPLP